MSIKVIVATHKKYRMPDDRMYLPIQVGRILKSDLGYTGDHTGDNISAKNPNYCELTAMYWAWKHVGADYIGLVHYRRHFGNHSLLIRTPRWKWGNVLTFRNAEKLLHEYDMILPKKRHYWIETSFSQYEHAHNGNDLRQTRQIIHRNYPEYVETFDQIMDQTASHRFNMFIMKRAMFHAYCEWLFSILFQLEKEIDISRYSPKQARVFGYISERLLDVWITKNGVNYVEVPVMFMEKQNWFYKIYDFLRRKFRKDSHHTSLSNEVNH